MVASPPSRVLKAATDSILKEAWLSRRRFVRSLPFVWEARHS